MWENIIEAPLESDTGASVLDRAKQLNDERKTVSLNTRAVINVNRPTKTLLRRMSRVFFGEASSLTIPQETECSRALAELSLEHAPDDSLSLSMGERNTSLVRLESNVGKRRRNAPTLRGRSTSQRLRVTPQSSRVDYTLSPDEMYECLRDDFEEYLNGLQAEDQNALQTAWRCVW